jgi:hypothetical protein
LLVAARNGAPEFILLLPSTNGLSSSRFMNMSLSVGCVRLLAR